MTQFVTMRTDSGNLGGIQQYPCSYEDILQTMNIFQQEKRTAALMFRKYISFIPAVTSDKSVDLIC
jgi:hypothetical protein